MVCPAWAWCLAVLLACTSVCLGKENVVTPDLAKINDAKTWSLVKAFARLEKVDGKPMVQLTPKDLADKPSNIGLALVENVEFAEGTLEVDLKGLGSDRASFLGLAFSVEDGTTFEAVYFRPFNFRSKDKKFRAVQYVAWPEHTWEKLRADKPGAFESAVEPIPDPKGWFHARLEVTKQRVNVFVNDAKKPCLTVDRLASRAKGKVGLWVDSQQGSFSNLTILPAK